jgi:hypothetical protein
MSYYYTLLHILSHIFMHMLGTILEDAINESACTWLNMNGYYSPNGNGCNLLTEIVVYND